MGKLVEKLNVEKSDDRKVAISEHLNDKVAGYTSAGIFKSLFRSVSCTWYSLDRAEISLLVG